jgi:hypothetical protein
MKRTKIVALAIGVCAVGSVGAMGAQASPSDKVVLCHGTASETNPYVVITVDEHSLKGHFNSTSSDHGPRNPDFLMPAGWSDCSGGTDEEVGEE